MSRARVAEQDDRFARRPPDELGLRRVSRAVRAAYRRIEGDNIAAERLGDEPGTLLRDHLHINPIEHDERAGSISGIWPMRPSLRAPAIRQGDGAIVDEGPRGRGHRRERP
jgi:hypothetical protein